MADVIATGADTHNVTAVFDTREAAEAARRDLIGAGFAEGDIRFVEGAAAANAATPVEDPSVLRSLLNIFVFMPPHDRSDFGEAIRRGGTALAVRTSHERYERAIDILDRDGAVDLDEHATSWAGGTATRAPSSEPAPDTRAFDAANSHDALVNADANHDVRERIGVGTADPTVATEVAPESAATGRVDGEGLDAAATFRRDRSHGRGRIRSYVSSAAAIPAGIDPQI